MSETSLPPPLNRSSSATTQGAGQRIDEGKGRIFPCEGCGADLTFHIGQQSLQCPFCGMVKPLELDENTALQEQDFRAMLARLVERRAPPLAPDQVHEVRCESCGAVVVFTGPLTSTQCAYCASPIQREKVHDAEDRVAADGVLPFLVERDQAQVNLQQWVRSRWFAPNDFRRSGVEGKFQGVYLPYWTFDSMTATRYVGERGEHYYVTVGSGKNKRTVRHTRWYPAGGSFQRFFDDVLVCAASDVLRDFMASLEPWPLQRCVPFNQQMLAGFLAQTYTVPLEEGFVEAKARIEDALEAEVRQRIGGDEQRVHSVTTRFGALTYKHLLLPVWLFAYRYREKPYQVVVNAATGEVQGQHPYSWVKITLAVLAAAAVAAVGVFVMAQRG